jgi:hypothetical protein
MVGKINRWREDYRNDRVQTRIPRVLRGGDGAALQQAFDDARLAPDLVKRVAIVTSSPSKRQVREALTAIRAGIPPEPHFVQLYWLLLYFFSACADVGAFGTIICQE